MNWTIRSIVAVLLLVNAATAAGMQVSFTAQKLPLLTADQAEFLSHVTMVDLPDGQGGFVRTARISGINVQIVNGLDATNGYPTDPDSIDPLGTQTNGLGNLIVGYNELGNPDGLGEAKRTRAKDWVTIVR